MNFVLPYSYRNPSHLNHEAALATAEGHDEFLARERGRRLLAGHELNVSLRLVLLFIFYDIALHKSPLTPSTTNNFYV